jgi:hypothetical protein
MRDSLKVSAGVAAPARFAPCAQFHLVGAAKASGCSSEDPQRVPPYSVVVVVVAYDAGGTGDRC